MTEHGFTPGPWVVVRDYLVSSNVDADENPLDRHTTNGGIYVAKTQGPDAAANARLIAASPTLLEALKQAAEDLRRAAILLAKHGEHDAASQCDQREERARAAITLATGEPK